MKMKWNEMKWNNINWKEGEDINRLDNLIEKGENHSRFNHINTGDELKQTGY